jgi:predicted NAD/FAD-binding protein
MKVGVVGGGAAGLVTAWLLERDHEVTLFERSARLGGHADTVEVEHDGRRIAVESGIEFFWDAGYPTFLRLLRALGIATRKYPVSVSLGAAGAERVRLIPPFRGGVSPLNGMTPAALYELLAFKYVLWRGAGLVRRGDTAETIGEFLRRVRTPPGIERTLVRPIMQAAWGAPRATFEAFSAYNVLSYFPSGSIASLGVPVMREIPDGVGAYIAALTGALGRTTVRRSAEIVAVAREGSAYRVHSADGATETFDHLVFATNARDALRLLPPGPELDAARTALDGFKYFTAEVAVHGDERLMPARRSHWSMVNIRHNGEMSQCTIWKGRRGDPPLFRSWIDGAHEPPAPLYRVTTYEHPRVEPGHFAAQARLASLQGAANLWHAGVHTQGIDCHESAVASAARVARRLAPGAARLRQLDPG